MQRFVSIVLAMTLSVSLASECVTFGFIYPVSFGLSQTVATDFVRFTTNREEVWNSAEAYISSKGWNGAVETWRTQNEQSDAVLNQIAIIDLYFRSALLDCHGVLIRGDRYFPPWHQVLLYRIMLRDACACFDELTHYLFVAQ
ncbi:MAG: hypothetical protein WDZ74_02490 [Candidatus Paceibacterota bacterium]